MGAALHDACLRGDAAAVRRLLDGGAAVDEPHGRYAYTNLFMMFVAAAATVALGELQPAMAFITANPAIQMKILSFAAC